MLYAILVLLVVIPLLMVIMYFSLRTAFSNLAEVSKFFAFRRQGEIRYVMRGQDFRYAINGVHGKVLAYLTREEKPFGNLAWNLVNDPGWVETFGDWIPSLLGRGRYHMSFFERLPGRRTLFERIFGMMFIGFPPYRILFYEFTWDRFAKDTDKPEDVDQKYKITHRTAYADSLYYRFPYAIVVFKVELKDNIQINLVGTFTVETINVYDPIMNYNGQWFLKVRAAVEGALIGELQKYTYVRDEEPPSVPCWQDCDKEAVLKAAIMKINGVRLNNRNEIIYDKYLGQPILENDSGLASLFGDIVVDFTMKEYDTSDDAQQEAARAREVARLKGEGKLADAEYEGRARFTTAKYNADAIKIEGAAQADAAHKLAEAVGSNPTSARVVQTQAIANAIAAHKGALSLGGQGMSLGVFENPSDSQGQQPQNQNRQQQERQGQRRQNQQQNPPQQGN